MVSIYSLVHHTTFAKKGKKKNHRRVSGPGNGRRFSWFSGTSLTNDWRWRCSTLPHPQFDLISRAAIPLTAAHAEIQGRRGYHTQGALWRGAGRAQTSLYQRIIPRNKNHLRRKLKPKIVATLNFILRVWGMLHPSTRLPREQDSFVVHCPIISKKLLSYIISVDVKFTLNGKSFQKYAVWIIVKKLSGKKMSQKA